MAVSSQLEQIQLLLGYVSVHTTERYRMHTTISGIRKRLYRHRTNRVD